MISSFSFGDDTIVVREKVTVTENQVFIPYFCNDSSFCTYVTFDLPKGIYRVELAGGNGGIEPKFYSPGFKPSGDYTQAGGIITGILHNRYSTKLFVYVGGKGKTYSNDQNITGGFNGGGGAVHSGSQSFGTSGGGSTDIRAQVNDVWHRIFVAGGGGGSDDQQNSLDKNDGRGGAGGGLISQSFVFQSQYRPGYESTQTTGFSFFQGEQGYYSSPPYSNHFPDNTEMNEQAGGGGGWFGGYSSHNYNGGGSGGSSFALTYDAEIPSGPITLYDQKYNVIESRSYAFSPLSSPFIFTHVTHKRGGWVGNGFASFIKISNILPNTKFFSYHHTSFCFILLVCIYK